MRRKMFYDCNPPSKRHWTYLNFIDKIDINRHQPLVRPDNYVSLQINPEHNRENLPQDYIDALDSLPDRQRRRFLLGVFSDEDETALFPPELLDKGRILDGVVPDMRSTIIAVDPSGCSGPSDTRSDEVGIVVCGIGEDGLGYVLADVSGRYAPDQWKEIVAKTFARFGADAVVAEVNYGGAMVREVIRTATADAGMPIPVREVHASRGKHVRAEPISALFAQGKVKLVGRFDELENQLLDYTTSGFNGLRSPDRADAMIWALTALFPAVVARTRPQRGSEKKVILGYAKSKGRRK
jgi:predicted phage terminase large subunit-like protein